MLLYYIFIADELQQTADSIDRLCEELSEQNGPCSFLWFTGVSGTAQGPAE